MLVARSKNGQFLRFYQQIEKSSAAMHQIQLLLLVSSNFTFKKLKNFIKIRLIHSCQ